MAPAEINGGDDDILGPMIGPRVPPTPTPTHAAAHTDGKPGPQPGTDDDILGALDDTAAATETGRTGVLSAQAEQRIREQAAATATAATAAASAAAGAILSGGRAAIPRAGAAARTLRDTGVRHWRMLALAGGGCVFALGMFAFGPGLIHAWASHRARPPQTVVAPVPRAPAPRPSAPPSTPERAVAPTPPVAVVARAPVRPPVPAATPAPAPAAPTRPVTPIVAVPHRSAVTVRSRLPAPAVRSSTAAQAQAARSLSAEERFFRHQGGGGG